MFTFTFSQCPEGTFEFKTIKIKGQATALKEMAGAYKLIKRMKIATVRTKIGGKDKLTSPGKALPLIVCSEPWVLTLPQWK